MSFNIKEFINNNSNKPIVLVQGLGFVGAVMSLVVANAKNKDYAVIGIEQDTEKGRKIVESLNSGIFPIIADDPKIYEYYNNAIKKNNFYATIDTTAFSYADFIIVDINLDVKKTNNENLSLKDFSVDMEPFTNAIKTIGTYCKHDALILIETTVPPGTCQKIVAPVIKSMLKKRGLPDNLIKIGHSYERVMPGPNYIDSIENFYRVYSGIDEASADVVESFLKSIIKTDKYPLTRLNNTNATEIAKVLENSYRAMNIAFIAEWSRMAEEANVNLYEVVNAIRQRPTHNNMMFPGIGVGGYCLTKDPLLASWAGKNLLDGDNNLLQSETAVSINDQMPRFAYEFLEKKYPDKIANKNILLLGVSYRGDVGDTRFSPVESFIKYLFDSGAKVTAHDPFVDDWPEVNIKPYKVLTEALNNKPDIIIICTAHLIYQQEETTSALLDCNSLFIYDTIGFLTNVQIEKLKQKHKIIILGRGDL